MLAFALGAFVWLTWKGALKNNRKAIISALVVLGFAVFLDFLDGFVGKNSGITFCYEQYCNKVVLHLMRLTEEVSEVVALGILGYTNIKEHCVISEDSIA